LKDDKAMLQVTVNGQLYLLMLVERLIQNGFEVISLNTDGIVTKVPYSGYSTDMYYNICEDWEQDTAYELEYTEYKKYIRRDINNYISVTTDGKVKQKGIFETNKPAKKGFDKPIVALAVNNYFLNGTPIHNTIHEHRDIYDFCMAQKIGSTYSRVEYHKDNIEEVQRSLRYYASDKGGELYKIKILEDETESKQTLLADSKVVLFNDYVPGPYYLNYTYYIEEARKIICQVEGKVYIHPDKLEAKITKLEEAVSKNQLKYDTFIEKASKSKAVESTLRVLNKQKEQLEELLLLR
jgi:hypothetical protein